jgi:hypothetical protein
LDLLELGLDCRAHREMERFDSILSWYGSGRPEFREAVSDLPVQFFPALPDGTCHVVDYYLRQVGGPDGLVPCIDTGASAKRDFIAIHPFSGSRKKNWPLDRFRELARALSLPAEFTAGPEEALDEAVRFDDLLDLARWMASARLYVGNDSGVSHLAAAVGTPAIVIFRTTDPNIWAPRGRAAVLTITEGDENGPEVAVVARHAERLIELDGNRSA